jgi:hypothetical protein
MAVADMKQTLLDVAKKAIEKGPGYSQDLVVLREAADILRPSSLKEQQELLTQWHELFLAGELAWGYDIDNPNAPFFHFVER